MHAESNDAGIFTWDIETNQLCGDTAVAFLFGLDEERTAAGLPVEDYLSRVHDDDRGTLARDIRHAMITSLPYQSLYRTLNARQEWVELMAFGHCFSRNGEPKTFSGLLHPVPTDTRTPAISFLMAAHDAYRREGAVSEADLVVELLKKVKPKEGSTANVIDFRRPV